MLNSADSLPEVIRALAHPVRWGLVKALSISDQRVQELVAEVHQPYNLVSYHLKQLRDCELVSLRKSDADGRDLYYHLDMPRLQQAYQDAARRLNPGWVQPQAQPIQKPPLRVLFLCTYNSARSQMAEGLLRHLGGDLYRVASAGSQPRQVHPDAVAVMGKMGIDISRLRSKHMDEVKDQGFDVAITVCDRVREECIRYDICKTNLHWSVPDPVGIEDPAARLQAFSTTAQELDRRIRQFIMLGDSFLTDD